MSSPAVAITTGNAEGLLGYVDVSPLWAILCGVLVMFMQAGFAMLEAGCARDKNVQSILMKNMIDICVGTLGWFSVGWSLAYVDVKEKSGIFGTGNGDFGSEFFFADVTVDMSADGAGQYTSWFFQWTFCATAATIVSGGVAERVNFWAYLIYVVVMTSLIYPCVVATTWGGGLFNDVGGNSVLDFAGSGIVHLTGGVGALVGAMVLGPRIGRFDDSTASSEFDPHSMTLVTLGTLILWMGWYGFNCGSTGGFSSVSTANLAGLVACNTTVAAASCGCMVFVISSLPGFHEKDDIKLDLGGVCNGVLAGLVSITAGCASVAPWQAMIIGFIGGIFYIGSDLLLKKLKIDDPLNAFPVHGACGMWGLIAAASFDKDDGDAIGPNLALAAFIWAWCGGISFIVFYGLHKAGLLRVPEDVEKQGLDYHHHVVKQATSISPKLNQ